MSEAHELSYGAGASAEAASLQILTGRFLRLISAEELPDTARYPDINSIPSAAGETAVSKVALVKPLTQPAEEQADGVYNPMDSSPKQAYPHRYFQINPALMRGNGVISASPDSRTRAAFAALHQTFPEITGPGMQESRHKLQSLQVFAKSKVILAAGQAKTPKEAILPLSTALSNALQELTAQNHPVAQLVYQLREEYADLPPVHIKAIEAELITSSSYDDIRAAYNAALKAARGQTLAQ